MTASRVARALGVTTFASAFAACATAPPSPGVPSSFEALAGRVIDGRSGESVGAAELAARLRAAQVILVGEEHASPPHHAVQREVLELVAGTNPGKVAIGVEWLPGSMRLPLAGFIAADPPASLDELRRAVRWDEVWKHDLSAYAPVFEAARRLGVPMVPLNAEPGLTRFIARGGILAVPPERRGELPPLASGNEAHRRWFVERMEAAAKDHPEHAVTGEALDRFYLAQLAWDETMAEAARRVALRKQVLVFAGVGHVERGLGIPARLGALHGLVIIPVKDAREAALRARDADFPEREADLFWTTPPGVPWVEDP